MDMKTEFSSGESQVLLEATIRGDLPDPRGRFGPFGGRYVPETLVPAFERLEQGIAEHLPRAPSRLLPRIVGNDQQKPVEVERVTHLEGNREMAEVERIVRPPQHSDTLTRSD